MVHLSKVLPIGSRFLNNKKIIDNEFHLDLSIQIFFNLKLKDFKPNYLPLTC